MRKQQQKAHNSTSTMTQGHKAEALNANTVGPAPFTTLTWASWTEIETHIKACLDRFLEAIDQDKSMRALFLALEIQEATLKLLDEVYGKMVADGLEPLPIASPLAPDRATPAGVTG